MTGGSVVMVVCGAETVVVVVVVVVRVVNCVTETCVVPFSDAELCCCVQAVSKSRSIANPAVARRFLNVVLRILQPPLGFISIAGYDQYITNFR